MLFSSIFIVFSAHFLFTFIFGRTLIFVVNESKLTLGQFPIVSFVISISYNLQGQCIIAKFKYISLSRNLEVPKIPCLGIVLQKSVKRLSKVFLVSAPFGRPPEAIIDVSKRGVLTTINLTFALSLFSSRFLV